MPNDNTGKGSSLTPLSRRRVLAALGSGTAVGLAGCSGGDGNDQTTEPPAGGGDGDGDGTGGDGDGTGGDGDGDTATTTALGEPLDRTFTVSQPSTLPPDMQWNPFNQEGGFPRDGQQFEFAPFEVMLLKEQEAFTVLLDDYSLDGTTATLTLNDWFTWTNGDDVTGKDLETQLILAKKMSYPHVADATDIQQTGDYTVEIELDSEKNALLFWSQFMNYGATRPRRLTTPHSVFKQFREKFDDVTTETARSDAVTELGTWELDEPVGYGPYHLNPDRTTEEKMVYEKNDDWPVAKVQEQISDQIGYDFSDWPDENRIPETEVIYSGERKTELILSDTLDSAGLTTITPELRNESPDHMEMLPVITFSGTNLVPNLGDEHMGKRKVRQAIAHLIPYEQAGQLMYGELAQPDTYQTSLPPSIYQNWLSEDIRNNLVNYERNTEKAESLLQEAGYSKSDGQWQDEDGNTLTGGSIPIPASLNQKVKAFNAIAQQLTDFGIKTDLQTSDWSGWSDTMDNRDYKLAHSYMGGGPHPYNAFTPVYGSTWWTNNRPFYEGETVTVPDMQNSDDTMEVQPTALYDELEKNLSEDRQREIIEKLVWTFNHDLPFIGLTFKDAATMRTTDHWRVVPKDDRMQKNRGARYLQLYSGLLQPKHE